MDRNFIPTLIIRWIVASHSLRSAWIEIKITDGAFISLIQSHSLRSAWIEIQSGKAEAGVILVALLTECVDRNNCRFMPGQIDAVSHSLRSAWIEITTGSVSSQAAALVALLTECVDRNLKDLSQSTTRLGRTL